MGSLRVKRVKKRVERGGEGWRGVKSDTVFNYYVLLLGAAGSSLPSVGPSLDPSLDPFLDPSLNASASPGRGWVSLTRGGEGGGLYLRGCTGTTLSVKPLQSSSITLACLIEYHRGENPLKNPRPRILTMAPSPNRSE